VFSSDFIGSTQFGSKFILVSERTFYDFANSITTLLEMVLNGNYNQVIRKKESAIKSFLNYLWVKDGQKMMRDYELLSKLGSRQLKRTFLNNF